MTAVALPMSEEDLQRQVIDLARYCGWKCAHFRHARTSTGYRTPVQADGAGYPDLTLCRPPEVLFVELKAERGRLSAAQREWLDALAACGLEAEVWKPRDFEAFAARLRRPPSERAAVARAARPAALRHLVEQLRLEQRFRHPGAGVAGTVHQIHRRDRSVTLLIPAVRREVPFTELAGQWERAS